MAEGNANPSSDHENETGEVEESRECLRDVFYRHCTPYGDEMKTRLPQTSLLLLQYGHVYLERASTTFEAEQKMNFMRSAALLNAAKYRFESLTHDRVQLRLTQRTIEELHNVIIDKIKKPRSVSINLRETSEAVKKRFQQLRERQETEISKIPRIQKGAPHNEMLRLQKEKIEIVKGLLEKNTKDYTVLMYYIADKCKKILGEPPHKFAIAGLGSLAKKEVTLHSAFKYIIILDDNLRRDNISFSDMEYFRWFALLFNVIVIGLGETPVTSVLVEELETWYRDLYTPSGVGVEGLMPWVYRECTESIDVKELILPLIDYVLYFYSLRDEENALKLKSLLRQQCFIYGSRSIYDQFAKVVRSILTSKTCTAKEIPSVVSDNTNQLMEATPFVRLGHPQFKKDSFFYRPISDCLAYIGGFFNWSSFSGFEIIASLKNFSSDLGAVCGHFQKCHQTELALAAACELRMKVYALGNGSRSRVISGAITKFIDRQCVYVCMEQAWILTRYLDSVRIYADKRKTLDLKTCKLSAIWDNRQESILKEQLDNLEKNRGMSKHDKSIILLNIIHFGAMVRNTKFESDAARDNEMETVKRYLLRHPGYIENISAMSTLIGIYQYQNRPEEVLKVCEDFFKSMPDRKPLYNSLVIRMFQIKALNLTHSFADVFNYCENALRQNDDVEAQMVFKKARVLSQIQQNTISILDARNTLFDLINLAAYKGSKTNTLMSILQFIEDIFYIQYQKEWFEDAFETCKFAYLLADSKAMAISIEDIPRFIGAPGAHCYLIMASRVSDGYSIRRLTGKLFDICSKVDFDKNIRYIFSEALELVFKEHLKTPSVYNISLMNSCLLVVPSTMNSNPAVEGVRKYLAVFKRTKAEIDKVKKSLADGETSDDCHEVENESQLTTTGTVQNSEEMLGATAEWVDVSTPTPLLPSNVPGTSAGPSMINQPTGSDSPLTDAAGGEGATSSTIAPGESEENSENVCPTLSIGQQGIFNLMDILQEITDCQSDKE